MYFYSASAGGFLSDVVHVKIPDDAVKVTDDERAALLAGQRTGQCIVSDASGRPVLVPDPAPSIDESAARARADRDRRMVDFEWRYERHARELRLGIPPTDNIAALDAYMQALADISSQADFPRAISWPVFQQAAE